MTPFALGRLLELQRRGGWLFQAERDPDLNGTEVYPSILQTSLDPKRARGYWAPRLGFLVPPPLVRDVFSSAMAAVMMAVTQASDGARCYHVDLFDDGIAAVTFGEFVFNRGSYSALRAEASNAAPEHPLPGRFINVFAREDFPERFHGALMLGTFCTPSPVRIHERVQLRVSDLRAAEELLGESLPWIDSRAGFSAPFTGPFSGGGQLQFDALSGEQRIRHRNPEERDRQTAQALADSRQSRWLSTSSPSFRLVESARGEPESGPIKRALQLIDDAPTRGVTVAEMAVAARMSISRFHELFRQTMGCTPSSYVTSKRLGIAEQLLVGTHLTVAEIAERCGFSEAASFTRSLRRWRGITPAMLRKATQEQGDSERTGQ